MAKKHRWRWVIGGLGVIVLLIIVVAVSQPSEDAGTTEQSPAGQSASAPANESAAPAGPATTITSGMYEVGVDVQAGQYKTPGPPEDDIIGACYWARHKDDSGAMESILANGNLEGPGSVTINAGEFFEATGECTWTMTG
ncbi:hypothetical protein [Actinophytocola xinjiangensis]|uniref:hypothetical protein n=1 Tax=Actinophytocola xinjiangensis TaxID=485602 RepID=UPI000B1BBAEF|nr:hypothetical protein [Actinophytocola xinjiangensis]